jgi:hypothetical protein
MSIEFATAAEHQVSVAGGFPFNYCNTRAVLRRPALPTAPAP